jgi:glycosyltransferase involved in cell wall biosynthesis
MKICLDGRPIQPKYRRHSVRGVGSYVRNLFYYLSRIDSQNQYFVLVKKEELADGCCQFPNMSTIKHNVPSLLSLNKETIDTQIYLPFTLKKNKMDVIHFFTQSDAPFFHFQPKLVLTVLDIIPLVLPDLYKPYRNPIYRWYNFVLREIIKKADAIITISENSKNDIVSVLDIPSEKIKVTYLAVDRSFEKAFDPSRLTAIKAKYGITNDYVFYLGGIDPRKNVLRLLQAFKKLSYLSDLQTYDLVMAGDIKNEPEYPELLSQMKKLNLKNHVKLIGYVPLEDLPFLYNAASLFVFPSLYEGFGLPLLEAMACGTPVVASNRSSIPEVVGDGGLLVDPENVDEMAEQMVAILRNEDLGLGLIEKGYHQVRRFSWERTASETLQVYRQLGASG